MEEKQDDASFLTKPPQRDPGLYDFFTGDDLAPRSLHGAFEHMAATSFARGVPDPDGRMVNSGAVGFVQRTELELLGRLEKAMENEWTRLAPERVSRAQKHRERRALIARLPPKYVLWLMLVHGPQDIVPAMRQHADPGGAKKGNRASVEAVARYQSIEKLGHRKQLLPLTPAVAQAYAAWCEELVAKSGETSRSTTRVTQIAELSAEAWEKFAAEERVAERHHHTKKLERELLEARLFGQPDTPTNRRRLRTLKNAEARAARAIERVRAQHARSTAQATGSTTVLDADPKHAQLMGIGRWCVEVLTTKRFAPELGEALREAFRMDREAWNAWADLRGRRRRPDYHDEPVDLR